MRRCPTLVESEGQAFRSTKAPQPTGELLMAKSLYDERLFDVDTVALPFPKLRGIGTAVPATSYSQQELLDVFGITDSRIRSVFTNSAIDRRFLTLPPESRSRCLAASLM